MGCLPGFKTAPKSRPFARWTVCRTEIRKACSLSFRRSKTSRHSWSQPSARFGCRSSQTTDIVDCRKDVNRTKETVSVNYIRQPPKLGASIRDSRGNHEYETPCSNEDRPPTLFIQPDPVRLQAGISRPTEVGCKLPALGNAELSRTNRALTRQRPRAPPEVHGTGATPLWEADHRALQSAFTRNAEN